MSGLRNLSTVRISHVLAVVAVACLVATSASAQSRRKIAVMPFDDSTAGTRNMNIGIKVSDALVSALAGGATFEVVDRDYMQKIVAEQNLKMDSRYDATGAAKLGKLANVDALIVGQVTAFNANVAVQSKKGFVSNKDTSVGTIELKVTARLISVETGSILFAPTANVEQTQTLSESSSSNLIQGVSTAAHTDVQAGLMKLVDKSVDDVAQKLGTQITAGGASIPSAHGMGAASAKVVGLQDGLVLANKGTAGGIKVGDNYSIVRLVDTGMKDPDTGKPVVRRKKVCLLTISEVEDSVSTGKCNGDAPQAGDELSPAQSK